MIEVIFCDFFVYVWNEICIEKIYFDVDFIKEFVLNLSEIYFYYFYNWELNK